MNLEIIINYKCELRKENYRPVKQHQTDHTRYIHHVTIANFTDVSIATFVFYHFNKTVNCQSTNIQHIRKQFLFYSTILSFIVNL